MVKFRLGLNNDKETEWLNEMARKGYAMTGFAAGFYSFDKCQPGEYVYQIDCSEGLFRVSNDYREFMRESGIEIVCVWGMWVILRRKAAEGDFVLYTDVESAIAYYTKTKRIFMVVMVIECICLFMELFVVMNGRNTAVFVSFFITAIIIAILREVMRVSDILDDLKERIGQAAGRRRLPSILIPVGLLFNAIGCAIVPHGSWNELLKGFCCVAAIIFAVSGFVKTRRNREV